MPLKDLIPELLKLDREEMVQAIEILQRQVTTTETAKIVDGAVYEVWSPTITLETATILQEVLKEAKDQHG